MSNTEYINDDGYPTQDALDKIINWESQYRLLMKFVHTIWNGYWDKRNNTYIIATQGWSGNEDIVRALEQNHSFWILCWVSSNRSGHYVFDLTNDLDKTKNDIKNLHTNFIQKFINRYKKMVNQLIHENKTKEI